MEPTIASLTKYSRPTGSALGCQQQNTTDNSISAKRLQDVLELNLGVNCNVLSNNVISEKTEFSANLISDDYNYDNSILEKRHFSKTQS